MVFPRRNWTPLPTLPLLFKLFFSFYCNYCTLCLLWHVIHDNNNNNNNNIIKHKLRTMSYSQLSRSGLYSSISSIANIVLQT